MDDEKKREALSESGDTQKKEKLTRREAMKRVAKGVALVGTLGVTAVITQGQDECTGGYVNFTPPVYYNYSNMYYNYSDSYYNYYNAYYNYSDSYYNYYNAYYNYSDAYYNYYNYSDYYNYYNW